MKFSLGFLGLIAAFAVASGAGCDFMGKSLDVDETHAPIGECTLYTCQEGGLVSGKTCPEVASLKPCPQEMDLTKPFPDCCPQPC